MRGFTFYIFLILLLPVSCKKPGCLGKAGPAGSRTVTPGSFSKVRLENNIDLVLVQGDTNSATIEGPLNIIDNISFNIAEGLLTINNESSCQWARDPDERVTVRLTFTSIDKLEYAGNGQVTNKDTLHLDAFLIESYTGAGDVELTVDNRYTGVFVHLENASVKMHGQSIQCNTYTNSRGLTDLDDFRVKNMAIEYGGLGDTFINVTDQLEATVYYKGNIYYKGNPVITRMVKYSSGALISRP
ncbi:MAG: DUF2807 domain-containing protein [Chitinophagaceae bacterium]